MTAPAARTWPTALRRPAVWLAGAGALYLLVNVVRAVAAPGSFATDLGVPLADPADGGWVLIYASRTLLLAVLALVLLARHRLVELGIVFAVAVLTPLTDAALAGAAGAGPGTLARHVAIALYLLVTAVALLRAGRTAR